MPDNAGIRRSLSPALWVASLTGLCVLPLLPEFWLWMRHYDDLKAFASIAYYELIVSVVLWWPALVLPRRTASWWTVIIGTLTAAATWVTGFQAVSVGARWDATAHAALLETNPFEAWGFVHAFASGSVVCWLLVTSVAYATCITLVVRARRPNRRTLTVFLAAGVLFSGYGMRNIIVYGGHSVRESTVARDMTLRLIEPCLNTYHPLVRLAVTQWNYAATHAYRAKVLREMDRHLAELQGATIVPGAMPPRVMLIVIGESASRRHWSLYGYSRETTPRLAALGSDLLVYRDVVCHTVGTLTEIQGMLCSPGSYLPILSLFSAVGYKTHWLSAQMDQGPNDVKLAALVQHCDERVFLNGAFDENLIPLVRKAVDEPGRHVIVVNLFGSHVRYDDRYPADFRYFSGFGDKGHRLAAYDNTIRYTDYVLSCLIDVLRVRSEASCFLYVSDHAEDVYDSNPNEYLFRSDSVSTDAMYEVPFIMWFSPAYRAGNPELADIARSRTNARFQSLGLYNTLVDLARLRHPIYDPTMSIVSADFSPRDRYVGALNRIYPALAQTSGDRTVHGSTAHQMRLR